MIFENRSINERIIKIRKLRGFSQLELADKLNMPLEKYIELEKEKPSKARAVSKVLKAVTLLVPNLFISLALK